MRQPVGVRFADIALPGLNTLDMDQSVQCKHIGALPDLMSLQAGILGNGGIAQERKVQLTVASRCEQEIELEGVKLALAALSEAMSEKQFTTLIKSLCRRMSEIPGLSWLNSYFWRP